jgi:uncharacterized protein YggE
MTDVPASMPATQAARRSFAGLLVAAVCLLPAYAVAQEPAKDRITVVGEATLSLPPDLARLRAGVVSEGKTAREATDNNRKSMTAIIAAIKGMGVVDKDIQTSRYSIQPVYEQNRPIPNSFKGFQVFNNVVVTIRDLDKVGGVIDAVVSAGANSIGGVEFSVAEPSKALDAVRAGAVADALRKAELYANAAGVGLGRAVTIAEQSSGPQPLVMSMRAGSPGGETPIAAGEVTLRATVTVGYELK